MCCARPWSKALAILVSGIFVFFLYGFWKHLAQYHERPYAFHTQRPLVSSCVAPSAAVSPNRQNPFIPNTIHQIWKDANLKTYPLRTSHKAWKKLLKPLNYTIQLWTDDDVDQLIETEYSWLYPTYKTYAHDIQRADVARLVVVHARGGIYADLDVHPAKSAAKELACLQRTHADGAVFAPTSGGTTVSNHFFLAAKGFPFLEWALREAERRAKMSSWIWPPYLRVFWSTGPMMVTDAVDDYTWASREQDHGLVVLSDDYTGKIIAHEAGRAWHGLDGKLLNYAADNVSLWNVMIVSGCILGLALTAAWCIRRCRRRRIFCH